ncbi:hypothetical protein DDB_G0286911 [Dictyostelium discoideum AX4]|uniref:EGF-like domain-containing protein n=1 Tax=Dictyostelium discoideum TaxID=44689 RepID=Q54L47_DICDI|nr:hypothetical protein DDB_G0286911 [Dictyostelium discoideum AX4]EAL63953.1 hypothetical protein DDB_G0286911 [Dictyostelium discoideum AX4]|eukprot:XP_637456.1 hypothetical protein DDB_G0286911 [Dictyostelium discoideum AX4]
MIKKVKLFLLVLVLFNFCVSPSLSSSSSECQQTVYSVSEVSPYVLGSLVVIKGIFCLNSTNGVSVVLNVPEEHSNIVYGLNCNDLTIDSIGETITCRLSDIYQSQNNNANFSSLTTVAIYTPIPVPTPTPSPTPSPSPPSKIGVGPVPVLGISNYIFTNSSCPQNCEINGFCDVASTCRCNEGYASFDCSVKVYNESSLPSPSVGDDFDTFSMSTSNEDFSIRLSHVLANLEFQTQLSTLSVNNKSSNSNGLSYTLNGTIGSDGQATLSPWLNQLYYNVDFNINDDDEDNEPSFKFSNYKGAYLPLSSSAATITINPTIDPQYLPSGFSHYHGFGEFYMIFEISNKHLTMSKYLSATPFIARSVTLWSEENVNSMMEISLSDIYSFDGSTVPEHAYLNVFNSFDYQFIKNYSNSSLYVAIIIPQTSSYNPIPMGTYTIQLNINVYDIRLSISKGRFPPWFIALIVIIPSIIGIAIIAIIIKCVLSKRNSYSRIGDHPLHH